MAAISAEASIRNYLTALRDPSSLRDDSAVAELKRKLESASDDLERLQLRQQILDNQNPSIDRYQ
ncbi:MAG: hypothetical protein H0V19_05055, partial [Euzebyales bacterium]|nr:hypothetical protein [Euzebyales bacterium]